MSLRCDEEEEVEGKGEGELVLLRNHGYGNAWNFCEPPVTDPRAPINRRRQ
jgi:hypothetical protein